MKKIIAIIAVAIVAIAVCMPFLSCKLICEGKLFSKYRQYCYLFFPPKDLYECKLYKTLEQHQEFQSYQFSLKYIGLYDCETILEKFSDEMYYQKQHGSSLEILFKFYDVNDKLIYQKQTKGNYVPFIGKNGGGLKLFQFHVPEDIPEDQEITCKLIVINKDDALYNKYGPIKLCIKKASEK
jgi:hypothetical protein